MWYEDLAEELLGLRSVEACQVILQPARELAQGKSLVLFELYRSKESYTPSQLADALGLSSGRIANILKSLQASGYVRREKDAKDARRVHVVLTDEGRKKAVEILETQLSSCAQLLRSLGEEDARELVRILRKIPTAVL